MHTEFISNNRPRHTPRTKVDKPIFSSTSFYGVDGTDQRALAMTFNGENEDVTVTPFDQSLNQRWTVYDCTVGDVQTVSPASNFGLQIVKGDSGVLKVVSAAIDGYYPWTIRGEEGIITIKDGGPDAYWGLADGLAGEKVVYGPQGDKQKWVFERFVKEKDTPEGA